MNTEICLSFLYFLSPKSHNILSSKKGSFDFKIQKTPDRWFKAI